jgi:arylsulfatase A-like enzyme
VLDRESLWENTVVVLVGDNGFHLGDHEGLWAKLSAFDASTRVPFIIAGAGVPKGKVLDQPVELVDLYPTLLALSGEKNPGKLDGKSLVPYMQGKTNASTYAQSLVFHYDPKTKTDVVGQTLIHKDWRYTDWGMGEKGSELYLRKNDPFEFINRVQEKSFMQLKNDAHKTIQSGAFPKAGESNRPRALLEPGMVTN